MEAGSECKRLSTCLIRFYKKSEDLAASDGASVEEFIVHAVEDAVAKKVRPVRQIGTRKIELPLIRSVKPGTLNLTDFDFDDLFA